MRPNLLAAAIGNSDGGGSASAGLSFWAPLNDLGAGVVNLTLARGSGAATFTRATTATTILSNGLIGAVGVGSPKKIASTWGGTTLKVTSEGQTPAPGASFTSMSVINPIGIGNISSGSNSINGTILNVKIGNRIFTDTDLIIATR